MKALRYLGPSVLQLQDVEKPVPKVGEVLLRVKACGICGSDVHGYLGLTGRRTPPMTMGHEFAAQVEALGPGVTTLQVGDRVAPYPVDFCGQCDTCTSGNAHLCPQKRQFGVLTVDGAFAEYICVPAHLCFPIADGVSYQEASLMEPLAVACHAVNRMPDLAGKKVLIVGMGTIGLLVLQCCLLKKPEKIFVTDLSDSRLALAKAMGADVCCNTDKGEKLPEQVDVAFEAVGAEGAVRSVMDALKFGGTAVWIGNNKPVIQVHMQQIVTRELQVKGSFLYSLEDFKTVVGLINEGKVCLKDLISAQTDLEGAAAYFKTLAENPGDLVKVVVNP